MAVKEKNPCVYMFDYSQFFEVFYFIFFISNTRNTWLGKALRIDINVPPGSNKAYVVPPDNPFINRPDSKPEIFTHAKIGAFSFEYESGGLPDCENDFDASKVTLNMMVVEE